MADLSFFAFFEDSHDGLTRPANMIWKMPKRECGGNHALLAENALLLGNTKMAKLLPVVLKAI